MRVMVAVTMVMRVIVVGMIAAGTVVVVTVMMMVVMMMAVVVMRVVVRVRRLVGAALGIEGRLDPGDADAKTGELRLESGIVAHAQPVREDLHRHVAVAQPPREPGECRQVSCAQFDQGLRLGDDLDQPAVLEAKRVAHAQAHRLREIEGEARALQGRQLAVLDLASAGREQHRVDQRRIAARAARDHLRDAIHVKSWSGATFLGAPQVEIQIQGS
jgi:hypothetical protein